MSWMPHFLPMLTLMLVAAFTPGPNNIMLAASGENFGFGRTIPHIFGVTGGFFALLLLVGFGLERVFTTSPLAQQVFRVLALSFIVWLSWRIATSTSQSKSEGVSRPQYFIEAAGFQFINPKAVAMAVTMVASFISPDFSFHAQFAVLVACFTLITLLAVVTWAGFGVMISGYINTPARLRAFNVSMAVLLLASMLPVFREMIGQFGSIFPV